MPVWMMSLPRRRHVAAVCGRVHVAILRCYYVLGSVTPRGWRATYACRMRKCRACGRIQLASVA